MTNTIKVKEQLMLLGDTHGNLSVIYDYVEKLDLQHITIIQVGDFGYGFTDYILQLLNDFLKPRNINLIINRGNHDNYYSHFPKLGKAEFTKKLSNIIFLKDFDVLDWCGKKILCIGGATSIDRIDREVNVNYWNQEAIAYDKIKFFNEANTFQEYMFNYYTQNVDIVISHTSPMLFHPYLKLSLLDNRYSKDEDLKSDLDKESIFLNKMITTIKPKQWIVGHFHQSVNFIVYDTKCRVLGINEMIELKL